MSFLNKVEIDNIVHKLAELLVNTLPEPTIEREIAADTDVFTRRMDANEESSPLQQAKLMIQSYRSTFIEVNSIEYNTEGKFDLVKFWSINRARFEMLSKIALWLIASPASSVASEACFSRAGYLVNPRRNRLAAKSVNTLIVVSSFSQ